MQTTLLPKLANVTPVNQKLCCWEEARRSGRVLRCDQPVLQDRPWCFDHLQRFRAGKMRRGWSRLVEHIG